jgi:hypothetical protein
MAFWALTPGLFDKSKTLLFSEEKRSKKDFFKRCAAGASAQAGRESASAL